MDILGNWVLHVAASRVVLYENFVMFTMLISRPGNVISGTVMLLKRNLNGNTLSLHRTLM